MMRHPIVEEDLKQITDFDLPWSELAGKTFLISGGNGFLPAYIIETLLYFNEITEQEKIKVIALVRNREKATSRFSYYQDRDDLQLLVQDVCLPISVDQSVDYIIHAASQASPKYYGTDPVGTLSANVLGTHNLLKLAEQKSVSSFLFFSSSEVYGQISNEQNLIKENEYGILDPTAVRSCYAESKRMGETMCVSWWHQFGVPTKIVRPFHTYGPGLSLDDGRVFADFVGDIIKNRNIILKSSGTASRAFCYLADAVQGFLTVLIKGEDGQAYNVGNPDEEISIIELAQKLVKLFPEKHLSVIQTSAIEESKGYIPSQISRNCPDISKICQLGWQPHTSIQQGFKKTIESFL